jgi:hypothetical protein
VEILEGGGDATSEYVGGGAGAGLAARRSAAGETGSAGGAAGVYREEITSCSGVGGIGCSSLAEKPALRNIRSSSANV